MDFLENRKNAIFKTDDTSNEKRRSLKNGLKKSVFQKTAEVKICNATLGESIRFRERE